MEGIKLFSKNVYKSYPAISVYKFNKVLQFTDNKVQIILHFAYCFISEMLQLKIWAAMYIWPPAYDSQKLDELKIFANFAYCKCTTQTRYTL